MFSPDQYELLDCGDGRKLERFGALVLDRPAPAATGQPALDKPEWQSAQGRYQRGSGDRGKWKGELPSTWTITHDAVTLELRPTPFGHIGVFAEQAGNWDWIAKQVRRASRPLTVLNLFGYTGGSTLAAAAAGASVVHVDAAKNTVGWARCNAELSGLADAPIRWITEDARKFVARELRRGNRYDAVILDPPSYGHGPGGEVWKIEQHLGALLRDCAALTEGQLAFMLLTCHSPGIGPPELEAILADSVFGSCQAGARASELFLATTNGHRLPSGVCGRWP